MTDRDAVAPVGARLTKLYTEKNKFLGNFKLMPPCDDASLRKTVIGERAHRQSSMCPLLDKAYRPRIDDHLFSL